MLMSNVYNYKNSVQAIGSLLQQAGPAGLLKGYWMTNLAWIPWNVIYIASYEVPLRSAPASSISAISSPAPSSRTSLPRPSPSQASRARMAEALPDITGVEQLPSWAVASCACGSAALGAVITQPVDVVKTRLQASPSCVTAGCCMEGHSLCRSAACLSPRRLPPNLPPRCWPPPLAARSSPACRWRGRCCAQRAGVASTPVPAQGCCPSHPSRQSRGFCTSTSNRSCSPSPAT